MTDMAKERLHRMSEVSARRKKIDSIAETRELGYRREFDLLMQAQAYWDNMHQFRKDRERCKNYTYGKQWDDVITVDGKQMTEEEYIKMQGSIPLKTNLIRRLVRNVIGLWRSQDKEPTCVARDRKEMKLGETLSTLLQYNWKVNRNREVNARTMEEFLISGLAVQRKVCMWMNERYDCYTMTVQPDSFFINTDTNDFRGWDVNFIGEVYDMDIMTACSLYAKKPDDYRRLREIYRNCHSRSYLSDYCGNFGYHDTRNIDFLFTADPNMCRVIEVWRKEYKERYRCHDYNTGKFFKIETEDYDAMVASVNRQRLVDAKEYGIPEEEVPMIKAEWFVDDYWYYYIMTPTGEVLDEGESPYRHKSHPYVFKAYPYIDGEIHSFVADVIDQQRYTNRLIVLYDWIMRASAKGVLLFPEECLPEGTAIEDIAEEWGKFNGVIAIKAKAGVPLPQQVANNSTNIGISELLNLQLKFFEDISGVNGALQGKPGYSSTSGALYEQQTQNAATSLLDILESFSDFVTDSAYKDVKNIQQFYDKEMILNIVGDGASLDFIDVEKVHDVDFDINIIQSTASPSYKERQNQFLMEIWKTGQISLQQMLEHGSFPFGDDLLQSLQTQQQQLSDGQVPEGVSPELMQQAQQGADMEAVNRAYGMLRG